MGILSGLLGSYGDDAIRAAGKVASNKADDVLLKAATKKADDVALKAAKKATKSSATQKLARNDFEDYITSFGTVGKETRKQMLEDYIGGGKNWAKLKSMNIDPANLQDMYGNAMKAFGGVQKNLYNYADNAGIGITVGDLMKTGKGGLITNAQKKRLAEAGLDLDDLAKGGVITANEADELYKTIRDLGVQYRKPTADPTQKILGMRLGSLADAIKNRIDDTVSPVSKSFGLKSQLVDALTQVGDVKRAREIAGMADDSITASMIRKEMQPYTIAKDLIGLKLPAQKNLNIMGVDTGIKNPLPSLGKKVGELPLKAQAAMENGLSENAKTVAAGGLGVLGGLLGASALGGGNNQAPASMSTLGGLTGGNSMSGMGSMSALDAMNEAAPSQRATLGGYTYDDLENAYVAAIMAGDSGAANAIADMIDMLDARVERTKSTTKSSSGDAKAQAGLNTLEELYRLYQSFGGSQGVVKGNITNALNTVSGGAYNPAAATFDSVAQGSIGRIVKAMGDSGTLSDSDKANALKMIPKVSDSPALAEQKFQSLYSLLMEAAQGE